MNLETSVWNFYPIKEVSEKSIACRPFLVGTGETIVEMAELAVVGGGILVVGGTKWAEMTRESSQARREEPYVMRLQLQTGKTRCSSFSSVKPCGTGFSRATIEISRLKPLVRPG